jgi:hypothetical protein
LGEQLGGKGDLLVHAPELAETIQLAIAPVFLLTAIGAFLSVMTTRLGRAIDRARVLEAALPRHEGTERDETVAQLAILDRRIALANRAVSLSVLAALSACLLIGSLFVASVAMVPQRLVPALFVATLSLLIAALGHFLVEVRIATRTIRVRAELIMGAPPAPGDVRFDL